MSKKANRYLIIPALFFCISGGTLFAFFARDKSAEQEQQLSERINLALRRTAHLLLKQADDSTSTIVPVQHTAENSYAVILNHHFNYDSLPRFVQNSFDFYDISGKYDVALWDCPHTELVLGYNSVDFNEKGEVPCVGRTQTNDCLNFAVTFTDPSVLGHSYGGLMAALGGLFVLALGVMAYFLYPYFKKKDVLPTAESIITTEKKENAHLISIGDSIFDTRNQTILINEVEQKLTFQESQLLELFCAHKNKLLDRDFILKSVWDDDGALITRTVDVFVSRLRKILKPDASLKIANVHGRGYRFEILDA